MRILCCLDGTNTEQIRQAVSLLVTATDRTIGLLYVTDIGPHGEMERHRERFLRTPGLPSMRREQLRQAEEVSAQDILAEGERAFPGAEYIQHTGRPEREIVNVATGWNADLILICPRSIYGDKPIIGPKSIGHVARFVLDHAPCPVLLVRQRAGNTFSLP
jgi:nucleotide-binding universal stress UspA family protein